MSEEVTFDAEAWARDLSSLLDAIEIALDNENIDLAIALCASRFSVAEKHGLKTEYLGQADEWKQ